MKRFLTLLAISAAAAATSCSDDTSNSLTGDFINHSINADIEQSSIDCEARTYYECLKDIICSTVICRNNTRGTVGNPFVDMLASLKIEDANGEPISFFSMTESEQLDFMNDYVRDESGLLSKKMKIAPESIEYVSDLNTIMQLALNDNGNYTKSGEYVVMDGDKLLDDLHSAITDYKQNCLDVLPITRGVSQDAGVAQPISAKSLMDSICGKAKRGDVIVTLPDANAPHSWINISNKYRPFGHAAVIVEDIPNTYEIRLCSDSDYSKFTDSTCFTLEAWRDHQNDSINCVTTSLPLKIWRYQSYLLGLCDARWVTGWSDGKKHLVQTEYNDLIEAHMATAAEKYLGCKYVTDAQFPFSKWAAPKRFTCTSLIWWCMKEQYGNVINSSASPLVSPSDVFLSDYTYVKAVVK